MGLVGRGIFVSRFVSFLHLVLDTFTCCLALALKSRQRDMDMNTSLLQQVVLQR